MVDEVVKKSKKSKTSGEEKLKKKEKKKEDVKEEKKEKKKQKKAADEDVVVEEKPLKKKRKKEAAEETPSKKKASEEAVDEESPKKKKKKKKKSAEEVEEPAKEEEEEPVEPVEEEAAPVEAAPAEEEGAVKKLFVNNLPWAIDEEQMKAFFGEGVSSIEWIEDKDTGRFKGMAVVDFETAALALKGIEKNATELSGRTVYCRLDGAEKKKRDGKPVKAKPDGCKKLYCGNLSYQIDDAKIKDFFDSVVVDEVKWVSDRESGDFKGCGFLTFQTSEMADKAILKQGDTLLGRPIRLDWAEERERQNKW